jgi:hypothetical protein
MTGIEIMVCVCVGSLFSVFVAGMVGWAAISAKHEYEYKQQLQGKDVQFLEE